MPGNPALHEFDDPPELIELHHERMIAQIDPDGAYVDSLTVTGEAEVPLDLLFPRQAVEVGEVTKMRGTHPCLPIFGPYEGLKQHGFGRDLTWQVLSKSPAHVRLGLDITGAEQEPGTTTYKGLASELTYVIEDDDETGPRFRAELKMTNHGYNPLVVAPGLHTYFPLPPGVKANKVELHDLGNPNRHERYQFSAEMLAQAPMIDSRDSNGHLLAQMGGGIQIWNKDLPMNVIWTDRPDDYLCIEPTSDGALEGLLDRHNFLNPGQTYTYSTDINWLGFKRPIELPIGARLAPR